MTQIQKTRLSGWCLSESDILYIKDMILQYLLEKTKERERDMKIHMQYYIPEVLVIGYEAPNF